MVFQIVVDLHHRTEYIAVDCVKTRIVVLPNGFRQHRRTMTLDDVQINSELNKARS